VKSPGCAIPRLLGKIHATQARPPAGSGTGPTVGRASLQAGLLAAHERALRLHARVQQLEKRLSETLGEQAWRESGLGAPAGIDALSHTITRMEQQAADLRIQPPCSDAHPAAGRERESLTHDKHHRSKNRRRPGHGLTGASRR
jgi:hypothetical protein